MRRHSGELVKRFGRTFFVVAFFAVAISCVFGDTLIGKSALWGFDWMAWFHPYAASLEQRFGAGRMLLWNSQFSLGYPQFAEGQSLVLYPPMLLLLKFVPAWWAMNLCIAGHFLLAALGTYAFARRRGLPLSSALLAASTYAFSGFMTTHYMHPGVIIAACWMPVLLAVVEAGLQARRIVPHFLWAGIIVCLQILGGHQQFTFYALLLASIYIACRCVRDARPNAPVASAGVEESAREATRKSSGAGKALRFGLLALCAMIVIGVGLSAVQLAATYEMLPWTFRRALPRELLVTGYGLPPENLWTFLLPHLFGTAREYLGRSFFWETSLYVSMLPWIAAFAGFLLRPRDRNLRFWLAVVLGALLLAVVESNPLYSVLPSVPVFNWFRAPSRYVVLSAFGLAMLLGHGHALLMQADEAARARAARWLGLAGIVGAAVVVMANLAFCGGDSILWAMLHGQGATFARPVKTQADTIFNSLAGWDGVFLFAEVALGFALMAAMARRRVNLRGATGVLLLLLLADLSRVAMTIQERTTTRYFSYQPPVTAFLKRQPGVFRVWTENVDLAVARQSPNLRDLPDDFINKGLLLPNANLWSGISHLSSTSGLDLLRPFNLQKYITLAPGEQFLSGTDETSKKPLVLSGLDAPTRARLLDLLNIRFVVTTQEMPVPDWKVVWNDGLRVYENRRVLPRAFLVGAAQVGTASDALRALLSPQYDIRRNAFIEAPPALPLPQIAPANFSGTATIREYDDTQITLQTQSAAPALLVIGDAWYPGWRAWVDGVETPVVIADYALRGVALAAGNHSVVCRYQPRWGLPSIGISALTAIAIGLALLLERKKRRAN